MTKVLLILRGLKAFFIAFIRRRDPVQAVSTSGFSVLPGWPTAPEEALLAEAKSEKFRPKGHPIASLFCFSGPHQGELKHVNQATTTIGSCAGDSLVLTPELPATGRVIRVFPGTNITLTAESGTTFKLNGRDEQKAELFDFDQVELMGSKFLVLEIQGGQP